MYLIQNNIDFRTLFQMKIHLIEKYPDWLSDVKENYIKYSGGANEVKNFADFNYFMKKSWMNVRLPIIKKYKLVDKEYESVE